MFLGNGHAPPRRRARVRAIQACGVASPSASPAGLAAFVVESSHCPTRSFSGWRSCETDRDPIAPTAKHGHKAQKKRAVIQVGPLQESPVPASAAVCRKTGLQIVDPPDDPSRFRVTTDPEPMCGQKHHILNGPPIIRHQSVVARTHRAPLQDACPIERGDRQARRPRARAKLMITPRGRAALHPSGVDHLGPQGRRGG